MGMMTKKRKGSKAAKKAMSGEGDGMGMMKKKGMAKKRGMARKAMSY